MLMSKAGGDTQRVAQRVPYFDVLRVVAIFAVVVIHVSAMYWKATDANSPAWWTMNAWNAISRFAVPVFVMISGALFLNPDRPFSMKKMIRKNIVRLLIAFAVWTIIYAFLSYYLYRNSLFDTITTLLSGHYHMWFVIMIVCLYLLVPLLRKITLRRDYVEYFLIIGILLTCCLPGVIDFLEGLTMMTENRIIHVVYNAASNIGDVLQKSFVIGYVVYFMLGYYLSEIKLSKKTRILIYVLGIIGAIFAATYTGVVVRRSGVKWGMFDELSPGIVVWSAAVFIFARYCFRKPTGRVIGLLSRLSFGIYLVHAAVLEFFVFKVGICRSGEGMNLWKILGFSAMIFAISAVVVWIISKIPILKKYMI